ncbi:MAG: hypothetical protein J5915_11505, partial [Acidaminococcaceae bacterium]|nr:hypothetical protein [Acidaminococcaceae bacterium]
KNVYLIDYENVNEDGLEGSNKLTKNDYVNIFTSKNAPLCGDKMFRILRHLKSDAFLQIIIHNCLKKNNPDLRGLKAVLNRD